MEHKSIGGALVDVFDAGVTLVKSEINAVTRRVGDIAKAKGLGVVLLLGSLVPLTLALIFLILFVYFGLIRLGLAPWSASLLLGLYSLIVTGALIFMALKKLGGDVPDSSGPNRPMSDIEKDDLKYGYTGNAKAATGSHTDAGHTSTGYASTSRTGSGHDSAGHTTGGHPVTPAARPATSSTGGTHGHGAPQSTSTHGKPSDEPEREGIPVSTRPTYAEDMKKEGY